MIYSALVQVNLWHSMINTMQKKAKKRREKRMAEIKIIEEIKERRQRKWECRPNYMESTWGRMLRSDRINDPTDRKGGKLFRRRFRVPYPIYLQLVDITRASGVFKETPDAAGNPAAPLELKILSVLRVLGRGYCFDGVEELTCISAEVLRVFFKNFCEYFARENFARYCNPPSTPEEIANCTGIYGRLGLPGCIGSTDCVHVRWERCHASERSNHKGKEGYATLSYEVTVDHRKKIIAATIGHPGCRNDKTIVKFDGFVTAIHDGDIYSDVEFDLKKNDGTTTKEKGLYLIVDGGYHKWRCLQCPLKHTSIPKDALWSKWVESVRKDVECVFGILKGRFRCLKLPIYHHDNAVIDNMFFTCCILHNMLLTEDGYDRRWENGVNWAGQVGNHEEDEMPAIFRKHYIRSRNATTTTDFSLIGINAVINNYAITHCDIEEEIEPTQETLRRRLIEHFGYCYQRNQIHWLS